MLIANHSTAQTDTLQTCTRAVNSALIYLEAKQQIALQRKNTGDFSQAAYQAQLHELNTQAQRITLDQCMNSTPEQLALYQCLDNYSGNISQCAMHLF